MSEPMELTDANFEEEILKAETPALVDFWAEWCAPCRMIAPVVEEVAKEYEGKLKVGKLNVDSQQQTAIKYAVRSIPTLLLFRNGEVAGQVVGVVPKAVLVEKVKKVLE